MIRRPPLRLVTAVAACAAALVVPGGLVAATHAEAPAAPEAATRTFELSYRAVIDDLPADAKEVEIWIPYPTDDAAQEVEVTAIAATYPTRIEKEAEFGNSILYMAVEEPREGPIVIEMTTRVRRQEKLRKGYAAAAPHHRMDLPEEIAKWLEPDRLVPLDERIRALSAEVTAGKKTDLERARAIYDYVVDTMSYDKSGTGWGRGDIYWACDVKTGNCTDFHALFTGLARAAGIPAKFAIGFPIPADRGEGEVAGYHCWSEFWLADYGWVPVDASEARKHPEKREYFFGAHDENRVELSEGRDLVLSPRQHGEPLNFFVYPYVEVDGKPWGAVTQHFSYRDLAPDAELSASAPAGRGAGNR